MLEEQTQAVLVNASRQRKGKSTKPEFGVNSQLSPLGLGNSMAKARRSADSRWREGCPPSQAEMRARNVTAGYARAEKVWLVLDEMEEFVSGDCGAGAAPVRVVQEVEVFALSEH